LAEPAFDPAEAIEYYSARCGQKQLTKSSPVLPELASACTQPELLRVKNESCFFAGARRANCQLQK
jgi:hypothetical protein